MQRSSPYTKFVPEEKLCHIAIEHSFSFLLIFVGPTSFDGISKANKRALSDSQYPPEDFP